MKYNVSGTVISGVYLRNCLRKENMGTEVQDIKDRLNIVDFIGEYVRLQKAGSSFKGLCPFHNEKSPSFMVSEERQSWHCFGCSKGGDIYTFLMEQEGMEFKEALRVLADRAGVEIKKTGNREQGTGNSTKNTIEILEVATQFYEKQLWEGERQKKTVSYLHDRGLTDESIRAFRLGYAPDGWDNILKFLVGRGYSAEDIEATGLLVKKESSGEIRNTKYEIRFYDRFRARIMFPITDVLGRIIGHSARVLPGADEKHAKYVNTPESPVYHKSKALYGVAQAKRSIKELDQIILVEGNMDVIAMYQAGFKNTVAVSGTALTEEHVRTVKRYTKNVVLFFDMDQAGQNAARKSAELGLRSGLNMSLVSLEEGKDAAELAKENAEKLREAITSASDVFSYFLEKSIQTFGTDTPKHKKNVVEDMATLLMAFESEVERSGWAHEVAERIGVEEMAIASEINRRTNSIFCGRSGVISEGASQQSEEASGITRSKRMEILGEALLGMILTNRSVWEEVDQELNKEENRDMYEALEGLHTRAVLDQGKACGYSFDTLREKLSDSEQVRKLQRIAAKYNEEMFLADKDYDVGTEAKKILKEVRIEWKKVQIAILIEDMKQSEKMGDTQKKQRLREKLSQLTRSKL